LSVRDTDSTNKRPYVPLGWVLAQWLIHLLSLTLF
jgi:hypothetical protein